MNLVGLSDIATALGVSRQRVLQLRQREDFPEPVGETANGAIWDMDSIRLWARSSVRAPGRPKNEGAMRVIGNRFVLEELAMSTHALTQVFRAVDRRSSSPAAVKLLDLNGVDDNESRGLELGLRTVEAMGNPNVMQILAQGLAPDGRKWVAMPLATGSLGDYLEAVRRSPGATADVMRQVCAGLLPVHRAGIAHGDLKPQNVLRGEDGAWAIADFCLPRTFASLDANSKTFMAPELAQRSMAATARSDIYSLGRILDYLSPANSKSGRHVFSTTVQIATDNDPGRRYKSVLEFGKALNDALTATQEIKYWANSKAAADELRDRAMGAATPPEDLYRILEWAERLDVGSDEDMRALCRVFPSLSDRALATLLGQNPELFEQIFDVFAQYVGRAYFDQEQCDVIAEFSKRVVASQPSPRVFGSMITCLAKLGHNHERWNVRDALVEFLTHVQDENLAAAAVSGLRTLSTKTRDWNLTEFAIRAMPSSVRIPVSALADRGVKSESPAQSGAFESGAPGGI